MGDHSGQQPDAAYSGNVQVFNEYLAATGQSFLLLDEEVGKQAHLRFTGRFEGSDVVWDCRFLALHDSAAQVQSSPDHESVEMQPCFIEIGQPGARGVPLRVGLHLATIDVPAIEKMIIMIRNYKRLRRGRYEFGDPAAPAK